MNTEAQQFPIETVPVAKIRRPGAGSHEKYPFSKLGEGQSFFVPSKTAESMSSCVSAAKRRTGFNLISRTTEEEGDDGELVIGTRVYRLPPED